MIEQRSEAWFAARLGKVTASRVADLMAMTKTGYSASRANYMAELICERLTGQQGDGFSNAAMEWGTATEPQARAAYAFLTDTDVVEVGFVEHPSIPMLGASPDGLVGNIGLVEIKCPNTATHINTLLSETVPEKYRLQMHVQMMCAGREWCDFVSFDPRLPADLQLWVHRVTRDQSTVENIEAEVRGFLTELDDKVGALKAKYMRDAS